MSNRKKSATKTTKAAGIIMLILGAAALTMSINYVSTILALIGLGLAFWGVTLTYIQTEEYVREAVLNATETSLLVTLSQTLQELDYRGRAIYLPPKYLNEPETTKAYIPKLYGGGLPSPEQVQKLEEQTSPRNSQGILITPPGAELAKLFESRLDTSFTRIDPDHLQENLLRVLTEDLEIASNLEMETGPSETSNQPENPTTQTATESNRIRIKITSSVYKNSNTEIGGMLRINPSLGDPLTSAIACALAKATGKPVTIENQEASEDGETIDLEYRIIEEEQT
jgi:hypothetical protein